MNREDALELLKQNIQNKNLIKHCLAVEAIMGALARFFRENETKWALAGLLHDLDYEKTKDNPQEHSLIGAKMLEGLGVEKDVCQAVKVHNEAHGICPETLIEKSLFVADVLAGLIITAALVLPSKRLADLSPQNVLNRFKEKSFARGVNREIIKLSEEYLNLKLEEFIKIGLEAMQKISADLGL